MYSTTEWSFFFQDFLWGCFFVFFFFVWRNSHRPAKAVCARVPPVVEFCTDGLPRHGREIKKNLECKGCTLSIGIELSGRNGLVAWHNIKDTTAVSLPFLQGTHNEWLCLFIFKAKTFINQLDTSRHARHGPVDTSVRPRGDDQQQTRSLWSRQ
ncbi:hypothetical protein CI102_9946 [Trichoderma harzianum]|nr:hypothetical protein CI102_9946 [Trichoderma harzianum]